MLKPIVKTVVILCVLTPLFCASYFQDRYRCTVTDNTIDVSLTTGEQPCMDYLSGVQILLEKTDLDLRNAQRNEERGTDAIYRHQIASQLLREHDKLTLTQQILITTMRDFEQELFLRVKRVVGYYLMPLYNQLLDKQNQARKLESRLLVLGSTSQYRFVRSQMRLQERELIFLERIKDASDFDHLIPPLQWWIELHDAQ